MKRGGPRSISFLSAMKGPPDRALMRISEQLRCAVRMLIKVAGAWSAQSSPVRSARVASRDSTCMNQASDRTNLLRCSYWCVAGHAK